MFWNALNSIASTISMVAFVLTAVYVRGQVKSLEKDRFLTITNDLFMVWQSSEFMKAQFWLLHSMKESTWADFVRSHRGDEGELSFQKVGSFYDRIGALVGQGLIHKEQILPTLGSHAIAVWERIEPLVREARRIENSNLFVNFEGLLPACHECYVPSLSGEHRTLAASLLRDGPTEAIRISPTELARRLRGATPPTVLDLRRASQLELDPRTIPGARLIAPEEVESRRGEFPLDREIVAFCA